MTPSPCSIFFFSRFVVHDIFFLDCSCARIFFWLLPNPPLKYLMVRPLYEHSWKLGKLEIVKYKRSSGLGSMRCVVRYFEILFQRKLQRKQKTLSSFRNKIAAHIIDTCNVNACKYSKNASLKISFSGPSDKMLASCADVVSGLGPRPLTTSAQEANILSDDFEFGSDIYMMMSDDLGNKSE